MPVGPSEGSTDGHRSTCAVTHIWAVWHTHYLDDSLPNHCRLSCQTTVEHHLSKWDNTCCAVPHKVGHLVTIIGWDGIKYYADIPDPPEDESYWLWWCHDSSSSTTMTLIFLFLFSSGMPLKQLMDGFSWNVVHLLLRLNYYNFVDLNFLLGQNVYLFSTLFYN